MDQHPPNGPQDPVVPLTSEQQAKEEQQASKEGYLHRDLVALDQAANVITGGQPDETISTRAAIADTKGKLWGKVVSKVLDVFQKDHGADAAAGDLERAEALENTEKADPKL